MVILERHFNQIVKINDEISITVLQFADGRVTIGIQAPKNIPVIRGKITDYRIPPSQRGQQEAPVSPATQKQESPLGRRILDIKRRNAGRLKVVHGDSFGEGVL